LVGASAIGRDAKAAVFVVQLEKIMKTSFELVAEFRETQGKGASRRLRHEGKVPAILYGGHADARTLTLNHQKLLIMLDNERFYSTILSLKVGDQTQAAILKDVQRHPFRNAIVHVDFQRVEENEKIRISIPLHFTGAAISPGVKSQGGIVSHMRNEAEVSCLPKDLPEFIEVDISGLSLNESIHLSQLKLPPGVTLVELAKDDAAVVAIHSPRAEEPEPTAVAAAGAEGAAVAGAAAPAGAPAAAGAAAPAAGGDAAKKAEPAKKEEAKKEPAKKDAKK
jgi:large subunit ribosomal protein L25